MKRSKFSEAQIAFILRQGEEGTAVGEICRKAGISEATYYNWRKKIQVYLRRQQATQQFKAAEGSTIRPIIHATVRPIRIGIDRQRPLFCVDCAKPAALGATESSMF